MAEIYRIGKTKVESTRVSGYRRMNLAPYMRAPKGIDDLVPLTILERAWRFKYLDNKTMVPVDIEQQRNYRTGLVVLWGSCSVDPLKIKLNEQNKSNTELIAFDDDVELKAFGIQCNSGPLSLLEKISSSFRHKEPENVIWEGFLEKNNLWQPLFASQFDDPMNIIKGLYINPDGVFTIEHNRPRGFDYRNWIDTDLPAIFGTVYNISCLDYKVK